MSSKPTHQPDQPVIPKVKGEPQLLGLVGDPSLNRDSGGSVRFGNRILWTYRDTQLCNPDGSVRMFPIISSTASWSDYNSTKSGPALQPTQGGDPLKTLVLQQYGKNSESQSFFPALPHICSAPAGNKNDGTRIALWPDQPPLVTEETPQGKITAYAFIKQSHIGHDLSVKTLHPATILYRLDHHPSSHHHNLPQVSIISETFWQEKEIPYGVYGTLLHPENGYIYLYAQSTQHQISLARVPTSHIHSRAHYEFYLHHAWSSEMPRLEQSGIEIPHASAGGQGTYFWHEKWACFVWMGGDAFPGAEMYVTTAPRPEGPWLRPERFYTGLAGRHFLGAYSVQAHPALGFGEEGDGVFLTWTRNDGQDEEGRIVGYTTPLVWVEFEV